MVTYDDHGIVNSNNVTLITDDNFGDIFQLWWLVMTTATCDCRYGSRMIRCDVLVLKQTRNCVHNGKHRCEVLERR